MTDHRTVEVEGITYLVGKLDAKRQFHVARRLAPLLTAMVQTGGKLPNLNDIAAFTPLAEVLASMTDEDCDYIIDNCLRVCQRKDANGWARIVAANGSLMYTDIEARAMMQLTVAVVQNSLAGFFPTAQPEPSTPAAARE